MTKKCTNVATAMRSCPQPRPPPLYAPTLPTPAPFWARGQPDCKQNSWTVGSVFRPLLRTAGSHLSMHLADAYPISAMGLISLISIHWLTLCLLRAHFSGISAEEIEESTTFLVAFSNNYRHVLNASTIL